MSIYQQWLDAKTAEAKAVETRRALEDQMVADLGIEGGAEGASTFDRDGYTIKITSRVDRKVDSDTLQDLASEHGLSDHLPSLFRWKPEINLAVWRAAAETITKPLAKAITAKPGRPSFAITKKEQD